MTKVENFTEEFRNYIDNLYDYHYTPEAILGYIYGVLHSPFFRNKYVEYLKMDFPRVPFTQYRGRFEKMSELGWNLVQKHLINEVPDYGLGNFAGEGSNVIEKIKYEPENEIIWINNNQYFKNIPSDVWEFYIGGYQVISKYLKSRKKKELEEFEIEQVKNTANILQFTTEQMAEVDKLYKKIDEEFDE